MSDVSAHLTLQTWMSAAFPTGAFTCSHGLEAAIANHRIHDADSALQWISGIVQYGSGWNDAVLLARTCAVMAAGASMSVEALTAVNNDVLSQSSNSVINKNGATLKQSLNQLNDLALALCAGAERLKETTQLGNAFMKAAAPWLTDKPDVTKWIQGDITLPVATGVCGTLASIPDHQLLPASLQASSSNMVWIATRLVPLGQTRALKIIAALSPLIEATAERAIHSTLDDLGSGAVLADLCSIEHEQLQTRICIT
ncbi:hypothetical protein OAM69_00815 [bacterium]|nr:hypothetical protein [bacterium]